MNPLVTMIATAAVACVAGYMTYRENPALLHDALRKVRDAGARGYDPVADAQRLRALTLPADSGIDRDIELHGNPLAKIWLDRCEKMLRRGYITRNGLGAYTITPKGEARLRSLDAKVPR